MSARITIAAVAAVAISMGGCAVQQHSGFYAADHGSSLGGPNRVRVADASPLAERFETETRYVYRGGRDPVTGMAHIQEGRR